MSPVSPLSRRNLLKLSGAFAVDCAVSRPSAASSSSPASSATSPAGRLFAYVGCYTATTGEGGQGNGKGIYLVEVNETTGELMHPRVAAQTINPSWLALDPAGRYLYAGNEVANFAGHSGSVSSFAIERKTGALRPINVVSSEGASVAHLSVDATGKFVFVANYGGGSMSVLPVRPDGGLGQAVEVRHDVGSVGAKTATDAPPGSYAISGHDAPHPHMVQPAPGNRFVLQSDLGQDRIYVYAFDAATGKLTPAPGGAFASFPSGDGPRHFAFHPQGRWLYSLQEEASTVVALQFDPQTGALHPRQTLSSLPPGFQGTNFGSEILLTHDGRFVYAANRLHDTVACFSVLPDGRLKYLGEIHTEGDYPRSMNIDPGGSRLYVCNQRSDAIACFKIDRGTGRLSFTGRFTGVGTPACIVFLRGSGNATT